MMRACEGMIQRIVWVGVTNALSCMGHCPGSSVTVPQVFAAELKFHKRLYSLVSCWYRLCLWSALQGATDERNAEAEQSECDKHPQLSLSRHLSLARLQPHDTSSKEPDMFWRPRALGCGNVLQLAMDKRRFVSIAAAKYALLCSSTHIASPS